MPFHLSPDIKAVVLSLISGVPYIQFYDTLHLVTAVLTLFKVHRMPCVTFCLLRAIKSISPARAQVCIEQRVTLGLRMTAWRKKSI